MNGKHPALIDLSALLDGELDASEVAAHVAGCVACRRRLVEMREVDAVVLSALASPARRRALRLPALAAALLLFALLLGLGWSLPARGERARGERALRAVQADLLDGLELQASGLALGLDGINDGLDRAPEAQSLVRELTELQADLCALRREYGEQASKRR